VRKRFWLVQSGGCVHFVPRRGSALAITQDLMLHVGLRRKPTSYSEAVPNVCHRK
jgi:hypothetical protein